MALPKKTSRLIIVENIKYCWIATGNDNIINLIICLQENSGQKLLMNFDYIQNENQEVIDTQITPSIVEKAIKYGLKQGWEPNNKQKDLNLCNVKFSEL
ncbi:hypothetical protein ACM40_10055 [Chryseobacterium sp. BLS98]|uniref:hypothetical protein n=1 Tax=Chryseobacterium sp. BLS98 TaxID=885586 RepID=UPI00065AFFFD|nr:hypothetical protein [Chryseobacterium sp. BLS98]KMQ62606.1 hypothetical protein ACM40_10055 [Chryseobacterium sp. BLS98]